MTFDKLEGFVTGDGPGTAASTAHDERPADESSTEVLRRARLDAGYAGGPSLQRPEREDAPGLTARAESRGCSVSAARTAR